MEAVYIAQCKVIVIYQKLAKPSVAGLLYTLSKCNLSYTFMTTQCSPKLTP